MRSGSATDDPPNFWTIRATAPQATGAPARRSDPYRVEPDDRRPVVSCQNDRFDWGKEHHVRRVRRAARLTAVGLVAALALPLVALGPAGAAPAPGGPTPGPSAAAVNPGLVVRGSVHQVAVMHAPPGATAYLFGPGLFVAKTI